MLLILSLCILSSSFFFFVVNIFWSGFLVIWRVLACCLLSLGELSISLCLSLSSPSFFFLFPPSAPFSFFPLLHCQLVLYFYNIFYIFLSFSLIYLISCYLIGVLIRYTFYLDLSLSSVLHLSHYHI